MPSPCNSCAYKPGCATHDKELHNRLVSLISAMGGTPFYCHKNIAWDKGVEVIQFRGKQMYANGDPLEQPLIVCEGWKREVAALKAKGHFKDAAVNAVRRIVSRRILALLPRLYNKSGASKEERAEVKAQIHELMPMLGDPRG
jgi:hypothetical protein